jgi:hypothetical protein
LQSLVPLTHPFTFADATALFAIRQAHLLSVAFVFT